MEPTLTWLDMLDLALKLLALIGVPVIGWLIVEVRSERKARREEIAAERMEREALEERVAAQDRELAVLDKKITAMDAAIERTPSTEELHRLEVSLTALHGEVGRIGEQISSNRSLYERVERVLDRQEQYLLHQKGASS